MKYNLDYDVFPQRLHIVCKIDYDCGRYEGRLLFASDEIGINFLSFVQTERKQTQKRKLSLMFAVYSLIFSASSLIFFTFAPTFAPTTP